MNCKTTHDRSGLLSTRRVIAVSLDLFIGILAMLLSSVIILSAPCSAWAIIIIPTVPVGDVNNGNDPLAGNLYGGVTYAYRIGTTEVTNFQYAEFLNAKAKSDPLGLYHPGMGSNARGGITRSGSSPNFSYGVKTNMGDKPVNFVNWYDSIRFANWLNNGQGPGDTETGAYTLEGFTPTPSNGLSITRNGGATWFLTSENEWYKAAYHQPAAQGGDADNFWFYPTASNSPPTIAAANSVGDIDNPGPNVVNYALGADWNGQDGNVTTVGSAGLLSQSFYGTSNQGGNVWEWNEALIDGKRRGFRGGSFNTVPLALHSSNRGVSNPSLEDSIFGFRVATVPEPGTAVLAMWAFGMMCRYRKRFKQPFAIPRAG